MRYQIPSALRPPDLRLTPAGLPKGSQHGNSRLSLTQAHHTVSPCVARGYPCLQYRPPEPRRVTLGGFSAAILLEALKAVSLIAPPFSNSLIVDRIAPIGPFGLTADHHHCGQ